MDNLGLKVTFALLVAFSLHLFGGKVEGRFFPVVNGVTVERTESAPDQYTRIWGSFSLNRAGCDFSGLEWRLTGNVRDYVVDLVFEEGTRKRAGGKQAFGPWRVQLTSEQLTERSAAIAYHQCPWRWWKTETVFYPT